MSQAGASTSAKLDPLSVKSATSAPNVQAEAGMPSMSVEGEASTVAGQEGLSVVRGGGTGVVEREVGGAGSTAGVEAKASGSAGRGESEARRAGQGVVDESIGAEDPVGDARRAQNLEFEQRDRVAARADAAVEVQGEVEGLAEDPMAVGVESGEQQGREKLGEAVPEEAHRAEAGANLATGAVRDPEGLAKGQVDASISAQERSAEANIGIRSSAGKSRDEIAGEPPKGDKK